MIKKMLISLIFIITLISCTLPRPPYKPMSYPETTTSKKIIFNNVLILSGGAVNGIFSVGVLNGYFENHPSTRFDAISGTSIGSLVSSFAFINHTDLAYEAFKNLKGEDITGEMQMENLVKANSLSNPQAIKSLIAKFITNDIIDEVAAQSEGRYLFINSTNLDTGSMVVFDMTEIARQKQYDRYRTVLQASCSIPIIFPPVFLDGAMYYDGGLVRNMFFPYSLEPNVDKDTAVLIIENGRRDGTELGTMETRNSLLGISSRILAIVDDASKQGSYEHVDHELRGKHYFCEIPVTAPLLGFNFKKEDLEKLYSAGVAEGKKIPLDITK